MNRTTSISEHRKNTCFHSLLRGFIIGTLVFTLCMVIMPFVLMRSQTPEDYISVCAVIAVSLTAFASSFASSAGSGRGFLMTGIVNALVIILILICSSLIFGKEDANRNYMFSALLYGSSLVFSVVGARTALSKGKKRKRRH